MSRRRRGGQRPLDCRHVARLLQSYLAGDLDQAAARRVAAHLEDCRRCGLVAATITKIRRALAGRYQPAPESVARLHAFCESLLHGGAQTRR